MTKRNRIASRRTILRAAAASTAMAGFAGCLGDDDDDSVDDTDDDGDDADDTDDTEDDTDLDFEGESIHVMLNAGALAEHQRQNVIPRVEEKYNLEVTEESTTTGAMITQIETNPDDPPDVVDINVNGIFQAHDNGWLASFADYTDIVENYDRVYDEVKYYDDHGVSWYLGEVGPVVNTDAWDPMPTSWEEVVLESDNIAMAPFAWTQGLVLLLISSMVTDEPFDSNDLDVDAGFDWMEENIKPRHSHTIEGISQANQLILQGDADVLLPAWDIWVTDPFLRGEPIRPVRTPDPLGIAAHQGVGVLEAGNTEAGMAYVNELLSVESQEEHPMIVGTSPTNQDAEIPEEIQEFGAPTIDDVRDGNLLFPDFEFMWENADTWSERWNEIFVD